MIDVLLQQELMAVFRREGRLRLAIRLALVWGALAGFGLILTLLNPRPDSLSTVWFAVLAGLGMFATAILVVRQRSAKPAWTELARRIEAAHPELDGLLLTAVEQQITPGAELNYLQQRIVREALDHSRSRAWTATVPWTRLALAHGAQLVALLALLGVLSWMRTIGPVKGLSRGGVTADGVTITPGDTSIERGERLVVMASFHGNVPANVGLVAVLPSAEPTRTPLVKSLSDPIFGGSVAEVVTNFLYRIEYDGRRSRDFSVKVFEYPRLERADADLVFPEYTRLAPKHVERTVRISAVEGTRCKLTLQLNKPVVRAEFIPQGGTNSLPLMVAADQPTATLANLTLETNRTYWLRLVDADGRTNKVATQFVMNVVRNGEPELKIASPRGDSRPSALEEITFEGTVWDDFGVSAYGLAYAEAGEETQWVELGREVPGKEKRSFQHVLRLEELGVKPDDLITWFLWADDAGPDGQVRRTAGDLYFAEVRPFDEVFRQGQGGGGDEQSGGGGGGGGGDRQSQLAELQKQIINATWKLQRQHARPASGAPPAPPKPSSQRPRESFSPNPWRPEASTLVSFPARRSVFGQRATGGSPPTGPAPARERLSRISGTNQPALASQFVEDLGVVREAVDQAISQAQAAREQQSGVSEMALWDDLIRDLEKSKTALAEAARNPGALAQALAAEQSAFQVLLRLQQREYEVSRNRRRSQGGGSSRERQMQRQLDQLELTQPENRYENERLAQPPQSAERREQLQVMNRLGELARRQQDLNERLKELQTALQEARTEPEREEIRRQLKRLQEEEQRMLADLDELQQRMNQPENQSQMSEQRQQLEQTRQEMQRAAEAAQQGAASQALASGTRAQRQLQQMREDLRRKSSSQLAEDLRQLRAEARETEHQQQEIEKQMDAFNGRGQKRLDDSQAREQALEQLAQQAQRLTNLVHRATQLSQQTEESEPLASRELYDSLRKFSQDDQQSVRKMQDDLIERGMIRTELYQRLARLEKGEGAKAVELTAELLRQGLLPQAQQSGSRASAAVNDLKRGIERAAEKVVGDDTEALRFAEQQLEQLTEQLEREIAQGQGGGSTNAPSRRANAGSPGSPEPGRPNQTGQPSPEAAQADSQNPQQAGSPSEPASGSPGSQPTQSGQSRPAGGARGDQAASPRNRTANRGSRTAESTGTANEGSGLPAGFERFLAGGWGGARNGPVITGEDFVPWSDRLREVEELVEDPGLQNQIATARDRARLLRQEYRRTLEKPEWTLVRSQVVKPLVEVHQHIAEELSRRNPEANLVPIDRDPVPSRFSELVRRYYEELGKERE